MKSTIKVKTETAFLEQLIGYAAVFGNYGGLVGVILLDDQNHELSKPTGSQQGDFEAVARAFAAWAPAIEGSGQTFQVQVNVRNFAISDEGGASAANADSGFVSLSEGLAFVFPAK